MDDYDEDLSTTYGDANPAVARLSIPASTKPVVAKSSFLRRLCGKRRSASQPSLVITPTLRMNTMILQC